MQNLNRQGFRLSKPPVTQPLEVLIVAHRLRRRRTNLGVVFTSHRAIAPVNTLGRGLRPEDRQDFLGNSEMERLPSRVTAPTEPPVPSASSSTGPTRQR